MSAKTKVQAQINKAPVIPKTVYLAVFVAYTLAVLYSVGFHEPWRDEAQSWLLARDLNLPGLLGMLPSEGHPPLWYLLIMPLAKMGLPYISQNYLAAIIMMLAIYLLLFRSQLPASVKFALPFSYFFFYEYATLARSYCLIVLFTALIIYLYPRRFDKPLLFALCVVGLFNTHVLAFGFALAIAFIFYIDARQQKKIKQTKTALIVMAVGGLYLLPYLVFSKMVAASQFQSQDHVAQIIHAIVGSVIISGSAVWGFAVFVLAASALVNTTKPLLIFIAGAACVFYILAYKYNLGDSRHFGVLFTMLVGSYALCHYYLDDKWNFINTTVVTRHGQWLFIVMVILQAQTTYAAYTTDMDQDFSGSKDVSTFIKDNNLQNCLFAGQQAWAVSAIAPYFPGKKIYYTECQRYGTYYIYDSCFLQNRWAMSPEYGVDVMYNNFKDSLGNVLFIFNYPLSTSALKYMDFLYHSSELPIKKDEAFYLYRFKKQPQP